jgi:hypothetical protein
MMETEQVQEIMELRSRNLTPKEIARKLGLRVADVSAVVKSQAEQSTDKVSRAETKPPLVECLASRTMVKDLLGKDALSDSKNFGTFGGSEGDQGLGTVLVTRTKGYNRLVTSSYLIDYWCLGVKDSIPPRSFNDTTYKKFVPMVFSAFTGYQIITYEQAQILVWGAVDYAASLGIKPHADFLQSKELIDRPETLPQLNFGKDGKPFYVNGPYDDTQKIIRTLTEHVGKDNFHYAIQAGANQGFVPGQKSRHLFP